MPLLNWNVLAHAKFLAIFADIPTHFKLHVSRRVLTDNRFVARANRLTIAAGLDFGVFVHILRIARFYKLSMTFSNGYNLVPFLLGAVNNFANFFFC